MNYSGILVPIETMVRPITKVLTPILFASEDAPETNPSAPKYKITNDASNQTISI